LKINGGYLFVGLRKDGKRKFRYIHRLVAETFIPNTNNYPCINHKDENIKNNNVNNLEWCTYKYNSNYGMRNDNAIKTMTDKVGKKVYQYSLSGELIAKFNSVREIQRKLGYKYSAIIRCCKGKQHTSYNYIWKYGEEN
jgi:hypothetical protein